MIGAVSTDCSPGRPASLVVRYSYSWRVSRKIALTTRLVGPVVAAAYGTSGCAATARPAASRLAGSIFSHSITVALTPKADSSTSRSK